MKRLVRLASPSFFVAGALIASSAFGGDAPKSWVYEAGSVLVEASSASATAEKGGDAYIGKPPAGKRDEVVLRGGAAMASGLAPLLGDGLAKDCPRNVNASVVAVGGDGAELARLSFAWAVVTEIAFPAMDSGASGPAEMTLKLEPQFPKRVYQKGAVARPAASPEWKKSGFKLAIDGLDSSLKSVKQLGELKITQAPTAGATVSCGAPAISDVTFSVPTADAAAFSGWSGPKNGAVDYVAADGSTVLRVKLTGLKKKGSVADGANTRITAGVDSVAIVRK